MMERTVEYVCPQCGETITMFVDPSDGLTQKMVEDCQVCCRANEITIRFDPKARTASADAVAVDL